MPLPALPQVVIVDGHPDPFRLTIPVTIWPSAWTLVLWWVAAYVGIVGARWQHALAHSASVWDVFPQFGEDLPYLLELLLLGALVLAPLRALGWALTLTDPGGEDA
ncbi:MAG TPA: hypothetical protein VH092_07460 [Urbifossiella sp.]|jgi:hypothetical protein|nr:hypothetical protein [Urbifossiella sp.]